MSRSLKLVASCGTSIQLSLRFALDGCSFPGSNVVKVIWSDGAMRQYEDFAHEFRTRDLRIRSSLNQANERLRDAGTLRNPRLSAAFLSAPLQKLHRLTPLRFPRQPAGWGASGWHRRYCVPSYSVNGHDEVMGSEYDPVAYVYVMHPGNRLRQLRKAAGLTQATLGDRVGMSQETLSLYENGKRPLTIEHMRALAREIGCSTADLLDEADNPERLSLEERELLQAYRASPASARGFIRTSALAVAQDDVRTSMKKSAA